MPTCNTVTNTQMDIAFFATGRYLSIFVFSSLKIFVLGTDSAPSPNMCIGWKMLAKQPRNGRRVPTRTWHDSISSAGSVDQ